jgi:hypothetical protein
LTARIGSSTVGGLEQATANKPAKTTNVNRPALRQHAASTPKAENDVARWLQRGIDSTDDFGDMAVP